MLHKGEEIACVSQDCTKGEEIAAQLVGNKHMALVTKFLLVSGHLCKIDSA